MPELSSPSLSVDQPFIVYIMLAIGILLLVDGLYALAADSRRKSEAQVNQRLAMLAKGTDPKKVLQILKRSSDQRARWDHLLERYFPPLRNLNELLAKAGMTIPKDRLLLVMAALSCVVFTGLKLVSVIQTPLALAFATILGFGLPTLFIMRRKQKRLRRFAEQLPEATDLIVRSLRVGHPLSGALSMVADELPDPIGSEFGIAVDEMTYGLDLKDAIENLSRRVGIEDLQYMTIAINVQYGTGGNLAEVLDGLSRVIRGRFQMYRKIKAVSAEGRLSAIFLTVFPFLVVSGIWLIYPEYYTSVSDHPLFTVLATIGGVLLILNSVIMRWLTNFRV